MQSKPGAGATAPAKQNVGAGEPSHSCQALACCWDSLPQVLSAPQSPDSWHDVPANNPAVTATNRLKTTWPHGYFTCQIAECRCESRISLSFILLTHLGETAKEYWLHGFRSRVLLRLGHDELSMFLQTLFIPADLAPRGAINPLLSTECTRPPAARARAHPESAPTPGSTLACPPLQR